MTLDAEIQTVLSAPCTSNWLKMALELALSRDCIDVANDANVLLRLLDRRAAEKLGLAIPDADQTDDQLTATGATAGTLPALESMRLAFQVIRHLTRNAEACDDYVIMHGFDNDLLTLSRRCSDCAEHIAESFVKQPAERWPLEYALRDLEWLVANDAGMLPDPDAALTLKSQIGAHLETMGSKQSCVGQQGCQVVTSSPTCQRFDLDQKSHLVTFGQAPVAGSAPLLR